MSIIKKLKTEIRCADMRLVLCGAALFLFLGTLSALLGGSSVLYNYLYLPRSAPSRAEFVVLWSISFMAVGAAAGFTFQNREKYCAADRSRALLFCCLIMCFCLVWYPMFFAAKVFFLCFIDALAAAASAFFAMLYMRRVSLSAFILLAADLVWMIYCLVLNFIVFVLN